MPSARRDIVVLLLALSAQCRSACEDYCTESCTDLNGQLEDECGDCASEEFACRPGQPGWPSKAAHDKIDSCEPEVNDAAEPVENTSMEMIHDLAPCQYIDISDLRALSLPERAKYLSWPTVIRGAIDHWPALRNLATPEAFNERYGTYKIQSKRINFARERVEAEGGDTSKVTFNIAEVHEKKKLAREHIVVYDGETGIVDSESELLLDLRKEFDTPDVINRSAAIKVFSFGGGQGVRMANHGYAWIGLVAGAKNWYVAPGDTPRPRNPTCGMDKGFIPHENGAGKRAIENIPGAIVCEQKASELALVPTGWWHATCNHEYYTLGLGGQDSCGLVNCPGSRDGMQWDETGPYFCVDQREENNEGCFGELGKQHAKRAVEGLYKLLTPNFPKEKADLVLSALEEISYGPSATA